jgi:hypothetical protein
MFVLAGVGITVPSESVNEISGASNDLRKT